MKNNSLYKAVEILGGQVRLATAIKNWNMAHGGNVKISQAHIWNWLNSRSPMPPSEHCRAIEEITQGAVTRYDLRPDVFGAAECPCTKKEIV